MSVMESAAPSEITTSDPTCDIECESAAKLPKSPKAIWIESWAAPIPAAKL